MRNDKNKAITLRLSGKSYNEISKQLDVPKSTLSSWFQKEEWPKGFLDDLWSKNRKIWASNITRFNKERAKKIRAQTQEEQKLASSLIGKISSRELLLIGSALYWAEGAKVDRWKILFVNSDPLMIVLMMKFFRNIMKIPKDKIDVGVQIHPNISEKEAKKFWSGIVGIPATKFTKTLYQVSRASKGKRNKRTLPYGTCRVNINGVKDVNKLKGWIQGIADATKK